MAVDWDAEDFLPEVKINITLSNPEGTNSEIEVSTHFLGLSPYVLILPNIDEENGIVNFDVSATKLDLEALEELLGYVLDGIKQQTGTEPIGSRVHAAIDDYIDREMIIEKVDRDGLHAAIAAAVEAR